MFIFGFCFEWTSATNNGPISQDTKEKNYQGSHKSLKDCYSDEECLKRLRFPSRTLIKLCKKLLSPINVFSLPVSIQPTILLRWLASGDKQENSAE